MKVLIIHNRYTTRSISGENIVYQQEVENLTKELGKKNIFTYEVSNDQANKFFTLIGIWFNIKHYFKVRRLVKKESIEIVHVHNYFPLLSPSVFKAAKDANAKVVHTLHNYRLWCISGLFYKDDIGICELCTIKKTFWSGVKNKCYGNSIFTSLIAQLSFLFYKKIKIFENIDAYFVLTEFQKNKIIELGIDKTKIFLKPNAVDNIVNNDNEKKDYIFVGRIEKSKGINALLESWKSLDTNYVLTVVGTGELEVYLKNKYNKYNNIIFKGKVGKKETLDMISSSKYLIQPSILYETFGLTIIEAMSNGVPVIGYNIGTRKDFIKDGINGFLANKDELRNTIIKSFNHSDYDKLSENALLESKVYNNESITDQQIDVYRKIIDEK